jgi:hypothetical protein
MPAVLEGGRRRLAPTMQSQGRKKTMSVACGQLRAVADGSERRPKFGRCSRLPRRSPTDGGWRGSAQCCSVAELNGEASRGKKQRAGTRSRGRGCFTCDRGSAG